MDRIVFAGFYFDGDNGQIVVIINQEVYFSFVSIVIIKQAVTKGGKLHGNRRFVNRAEADTVCIT